MLNYFDRLLHLLVFQQLDHPIREKSVMFVVGIESIQNTLSNNRDSLDV